MINELHMNDIFDIKTDVLINIVDCTGRLSSSLTLDFRRRYPLNFRAYHKECLHKNLVSGTNFVYATNRGNAKFIVNFIIKEDINDSLKLDMIEKCIDELYEYVQNSEIKSIVIPVLTTDKDDLTWLDIKDLIHAKLNDLTDIEIFLAE